MAEESDARKIAETLVRERLVACAQVIGPISSYYRWQDRLESSREWLCLLKTKTDRYAALERMLNDLHPYDVPEIIATPITTGIHSYLDWLDHQLLPAEAEISGARSDALD